MADPFSVAVGALGIVSLSLQLLGGCIKGFVVLSTARNLGKDSATIVCMLNLQEIQLVDWARRAGLLTGEGMLDRRINAKAVEETLFQLRNLITDSATLKKRYGLDIQTLPDTAPEQQNAKSVIKVNSVISNATRDLILKRSNVALNHTVLQRFRWATVDKEKIEKLIADIHFFIRELCHLLDPWLQDDIMASTQSIAASMIALNQRFDQLTALNEAFETVQSGIRSDEVDKNMGNMATIALIKARRIGLEQIVELSPPERESNLPSRQKLLGGLESLSTNRLKDFNAISQSGTIGLSSYDGEVVIVEKKSIPSHMGEKGLMRAKSLAALLNLSKSQTIGSLQCRGIVEDRDEVQLIFHHPHPNAAELRPQTLLDLFHPRNGVKPPSLTQRIKIGLQIALLVQNFHRAGWLHKSLRSENILFFSDSKESSVSKCLSEPVLAGFAFSRQDLPTEVSEQPSEDPRCDIYRHPSALGEPATSFTAEMDIYSLGTILLEISEWRALRHLVESVVDVKAEIVPLHQVAAIRPFLMAGKGKGGTSRLNERMGDIYASALQLCFRGKIVDAEIDQTNQGSGVLSLLDTVIYRLSQCRV